MGIRFISMMLSVLVLSPLLSRCYGDSASAQWNKDELLVLRNVAAGKLTEFDGKNRGTLTASFLEALLSGSLKESQATKVILIKNARIKGEIDLSYQDVKPYVSLKNCLFEDTLNLSWSNFAKGLNLSYGHFLKKVTLRGMEISGPLRCIDATFEGEEADIRSLRAHHVVDFAGAVFFPEAQFAYCRVGSIFYCDKAEFHKLARFDHMQIDGDASFVEVQFDGPVWFQNSLVGGDFILDQTSFCVTMKPEEDRLIDMSHLHIKGTLHLVTPRNWPREGIWQSGIQYASWAPPNLDPLELVKGADFDPQVYTNLENTLRATGQTEKADRVGLARKSAERNQLKYRDASYWWSLLLFIFVGNGYHPGWALIWSVVIVIVGAILFQKRRMIPREDEAEKQNVDAYPHFAKKYRYSPIWYSLDLFVPAINLETAELWMPARDQRFLLFWMRIQRILGWIIIPVGLVAISGIVKP